MPGLVKSHAHAERINASPFMQDVKAIIEKGGAKVLADAWLAGAFGGKEKCIKTRADAAGLKVRSAGATFAQMWAGAGASIVSIPSNEVYNALQQGVAQGTDTSTGSFVSFRLYEQLKCVTAPGDNALWFMYEPVLISHEKLGQAQRRTAEGADGAVEEGRGLFRGRIQEARRQDGGDFKKNNVEVVEMTDAEAAAWRAVAQKTSYKSSPRRCPAARS
jgi:TRAP-type C4-dicarboxylate transport system substrate-binding protein